MADSGANGVLATKTGAISDTGGCREGVTFMSSYSPSLMIKLGILEKINLAIDEDPFTRKGSWDSIDGWILKILWKEKREMKEMKSSGSIYRLSAKSHPLMRNSIYEPLDKKCVEEGLH
ncbi:hypothetical protein Fot_05809 [Forsythia ovata]|uniref:Uncharacterized protein n=1 Tax=Forsythia ovata TaxID=205694 RepID=A0ABD1WRS4_9LAMI